jgi:hypothetical protein
MEQLAALCRLMMNGFLANVAGTPLTRGFYTPRPVSASYPTSSTSGLEGFRDFEKTGGNPSE